MLSCIEQWRLVIGAGGIDLYVGPLYQEMEDCDIALLSTDV